MIARWTAWIFPDNKSNPVVDEHCIIADRGVVFAREVVERGVIVVSERWHGVSIVVVVVAAFTEREPSGPCSMSSSASSMASSPECGVVVIVTTAQQ